jgi:hypothetical protein
VNVFETEIADRLGRVQNLALVRIGVDFGNVVKERQERASGRVARRRVRNKVEDIAG